MKFYVIRDSDDEDPRPFVMLTNGPAFAREPKEDGAFWSFGNRAEALIALNKIPAGAWLSIPGTGRCRILSDRALGMNGV